MAVNNIIGDYNWQGNLTFQTDMKITNTDVGTSTSTQFRLLCSNFPFMTCSPTTDVAFVANSISYTAINSGQNVVFNVPWNTGPEYIQFSVGGPSNDSNIYVRPLTIQALSKGTLDFQSVTSSSIQATTSVSVTAGTSMTMTGASFTASSTAGNCELHSTGGDINLVAGTNMSVTVGSTAAFEIPAFDINRAAAANVVSIGNNFTGNTLNLLSDAIVVSPNTLSVNTVSTLHLGSGAAMDLGSGASISIAAPSVQIIDVAATDTVTIGNAFAGNITNLNSTTIVAPNVPSVTGDVAAPTHVPPAGSFYLIVDATGNVQKFSA